MEGSGERLKALIKSSGYSNKAFAENIGVSPNYISILIGKGELNDKFLYSIRKVIPDLNTNWLLNGEGEMYLRGESVDKSSSGYVDPKKKIIVIDGIEYPILRLALTFMKYEEDFMKLEEFHSIIDYRVAKKLAEITESAETLKEYSCRIQKSKKQIH